MTTRRLGRMLVVTALAVLPLAAAAGCDSASVESDTCAGHCGNGTQDCGETGVDCGGSCTACTDPCAGHCGNGTQDCGETGVDCGGSCTACTDPCAGHCGNGAQDCGETGVDCGGSCTACTDPCAGHCGNGAQDCGETGVDCGGAGCGACPGEIPMLRGVSLAGADFGEGSLPGTYGTTYTYPTSDEVDHFMGLGMNMFRLPFRWERLQRQQLAAFDVDELGRIDGFVTYATGQGAYVLLDPHNYARYFGAVIGDGVPVGAFNDFWSKLADHFKGNDHVVFGLMNEPNTMSSELWRDDANAAIAAIRATGATNLIFVPGNAWTGAHSWLQSWYGTPNAEVMLTIVDPLDYYVFEVHQYLDGDSSGTDMANCVSGTIGSERLAAFSGWLQQHGLKGFLGEFGAGEGQTCLDAIDDLLDHLDARPQQWVGWTYWAAGPWWGGSIGAIEPTNGQDQPQTGILVQHL